MSEIINATYRDGAFVPDQPVDVAAGARVQLTVKSAVETAGRESRIVTDYLLPPGEAVAKLEELCAQSPIHSGLRMTRDELHERR